MICPLCDSKHNWDESNSFKEKCLQERSRIIFKQKLCYECFPPASRNARHCKERKESRVCKKRHPASLHGYRLKNQCATMVNFWMVNGEVIIMPKA